MATRKGIHISGNYVVHHKVYAFFKSVFFILKSCKVQTESYFISFQNSTTIRHGVLISY